VASLIDELIVELSLDPEQFSVGTKKVAQDLANLRNRAKEGAKDVEEAQKSIVDGFESIGRRMVAFAASIFGGAAILSFVQETVETNRKLSIMASITGTSVEKLSALKYAFDRLGYSGEKVLGVLGDWDRQLKAIESKNLDIHSSSLVGMLSDLGGLGAGVGQRVDFMKNATEARQAYDVLLDVSTVVKKLQKLGVEDSRIIGILMKGGFDNETITNLVKAKQSLQEQLDQQKSILEVTKDQTDATNKLNTAYKTLIETVRNLGNSILLSFNKPLLASLDIMIRFIKFLDQVLKDPKSMFYIKPGDISSAGPLFGGDKEGGADVGGKTPAELTEYGKQLMENGPPEQTSFGPNRVSLPGVWDTTTVQSPSGKKITVSKPFAPYFEHFLSEYEKSGGLAGPNTGGERKGDPRKHGEALAIDLNQIARDKRAGGRTLPLDVENRLADQAGLYPGSRFKSGGPDAGHFEVSKELMAWVAAGGTPEGWFAKRGMAKNPTSIPYTAGFGRILMPPRPQRNESRTEINNVIVHSQAADPEGIAGDIKKSLERATFKERFEGVSP
jgi:hypothetical protein